MDLTIASFDAISEVNMVSVSLKSLSHTIVFNVLKALNVFLNTTKKTKSSCIRNFHTEDVLSKPETADFFDMTPVLVEEGILQTGNRVFFSIWCHFRSKNEISKPEVSISQDPRGHSKHTCLLFIYYLFSKLFVNS